MILVTGATGVVGSEIVSRLSRRGVPVRALTRSPDKAARLSALPGVTAAVGDLGEPSSLVEALRGVERAMLISSSAPEMQEVQTRFVEAAARAGVRHIVKLSGIMPERDSAFRFARMHGEIEKKIEESGIPFTHLRAGEFFHAYFRQAGNVATRGILPLAMGDARIASIDIGDIAEAAVQVLAAAGSGHDRKVYPLTGPEALSMAEVAQRLSRATGREVRYVDVPPEDARKARLAAGMTPYMADAIGELFAERRAGKESRVWPTLAEVFGLRPTSFEEFAVRNAAVFRGEEPAPKV
ncbi:MAG TPA: SDR family oxidoreductase [Spirochaetia bacterium]|nr:SDR family oxidoreductase [Spirochaetia bacterium]